MLKHVLLIDMHIRRTQMACSRQWRLGVFGKPGATHLFRMPPYRQKVVGFQFQETRLWLSGHAHRGVVKNGVVSRRQAFARCLHAQSQAVLEATDAFKRALGASKVGRVLHAKLVGFVNHTTGPFANINRKTLCPERGTIFRHGCVRIRFKPLLHSLPHHPSRLTKHEQPFSEQTQNM